MWRFAVLFAVPVFTNGTCQGGTTPSSDPVEPCADYAGQATRDAVAATPRADVVAEKLTIDLAGGFTADPAVYPRVANDLAAFRGAFDDPFRTRSSGQVLESYPDEATLQAIADGTYDDWGCPNDWYGLAGIRIDGRSVELSFAGVYDDDALAEEYAHLPGLYDTWPQLGSFTGQGPTIEICGERAGDTHHYVLHRIVSGAADTRFYYTSRPDGTVTAHGQWSLGDPLPDWPTDCW